MEGSNENPNGAGGHHDDRATRKAMAAKISMMVSQTLLPLFQPCPHAGQTCCGCRLTLVSFWSAITIAYLCNPVPTEHSGFG